MTEPGHDGTLYRWQQQDTPMPTPALETLGAPAAAPAPATSAALATSGTSAAPAVPDLWSARATTTRGMIGRPASRAAVEAAAAGQGAAVASGLAMSAVSELTTRVADIEPDPPTGGTVYGRAHADRSGKVLSGRMSRLHVGWHRASFSAVSMIGVSHTGIGLVLGADGRQRPVTVRFFRPEPTRITLIGGDWAAQILVFRALALGAQVSVWTDDPQRWDAFGDAVTGRSGRVAVNAPTSPTSASSRRPVLLVTDDGSAAAPGSVEVRPWQTELTVLRQLDERGVPAVQDSHLVIAQRLGSAESAFAAAALRLAGAAVAPVQQLDDETIAVLAVAGHRYARLGVTDIERGFVGFPRR